MSLAKETAAWFDEREQKIRADEAEACAKLLLAHVSLYKDLGPRFEDCKFALENACGSIRLKEHDKYRAQNSK